MKITTIGLDLAKSVFQAHGVDETGKAVLMKRLHRKQMLPFFSKLPPCLIGVRPALRRTTGRARSRPWGTK